MPYTVNWSSSGDVGGKTAISIADATSDTTSTSLTLTGKAANNYGQAQQQNFVRLLENFARATPPSNPTEGQHWYNTADKITYVHTGIGPYFTGWDQLSPSPVVIAGLNQYGYTPDLSVTGLATRLNRIIGAPTYVAGPTPDPDTQVWGWGQTDLVPTYLEDGQLDSNSILAEANIPAGEFPPVFNNDAWVIFISRLRKAARQNMDDETDLNRSGGLIADGRPLAPGNELANYYNNLDAGLTPYQGSLSNLVSGFGNEGFMGIDSYLTIIDTVLDTIENNRFTLHPSSTQIDSLVTYNRVTASQAFNVGSSKTHTIQLTFDNKEAAQAYFNLGGAIEFNWSFTPSGSPSTLEQDWDDFLAALSGLRFDYKGMLLNSVYEPYLAGGSDSRGFYHILDNTGVATKIFARDVLDVLTASVYSGDPPPNGGVVINVTPSFSGSNYRLTFDVIFYLNNVDGGTPAVEDLPEDDLTDTDLDGTFSSNVTTYSSNDLNTNCPVINVPTVPNGTGSGTFVSG